MSKKTTRSAHDRYESYLQNIKKKGRKVEILNEETGVVETKFKWFSKKSLANMKSFVEAYELVRDNKGINGHSLQDSLEFCREAINQNGWETQYGNIRKVSQKMKYLVAIYDELHGGVLIPDSVFDEIEEDFPSMNRKYGNIVPMQDNFLNEPVIRKRYNKGRLY